MSGAIHRTDISYPAMIAHAMGIWDGFKYPDFAGEGGLPLNLEVILNDLSDAYGSEINWWEVVPLAMRLRSRQDRIEDYWERGRGALPYPQRAIHHNLAVLGIRGPGRMHGDRGSLSACDTRAKGPSSQTTARAAHVSDGSESP
jgi:hypothetical protein